MTEIRDLLEIAQHGGRGRSARSAPGTAGQVPGRRGNVTDKMKKPIDVKNTGIAFSQLIRDQRNANRVHWVPSTSHDPVVRRQDRDALNEAIRCAGRRVQGLDDADEGRGA